MSRAYGGRPSPGAALSYDVVPCEDPAVCGTFLPGRRASIVLCKGGGASENDAGAAVDWVSVGEFGVVHPDVLTKERYDIDFPCSLLEMNLELVAGGLGSNPMLSAPFRTV